MTENIYGGMKQLGGATRLPESPEAAEGIDAFFGRRKPAWAR
mgnify:CR=1 FL=1